jgi:hypothetical protein
LAIAVALLAGVPSGGRYCTCGGCNSAAPPRFDVAPSRVQHCVQNANHDVREDGA